MSTPSDNGSWTPQGGDDAQQAAQAGQGVPAQDPWAQPQDGQQGYQQYGQQNPYGAPQAEQPAAQPPYGQASGASASDPYGQAAGTGQPNWTPAGGPVPSGSDPYGQPGGAAYGPHGGQHGGPQAPMGAAPDPQAQSRLAVGLLGIFLGALGVHRFMLGYTTIGIIQVAVTVLSCFLLYPVVQIWGIIEGIMVLAKSPSFERDARGRPLTD